MKVSCYPSGLTESYVVKYWYKDIYGCTLLDTETFYSSSNKAHKQVKNYFLKTSAKNYDGVEVISVTCE